MVQREGAVAGLAHLLPQTTHPFPTEQVRERWAREIDDEATHCFAVPLLQRYERRLSVEWG